MIVRISGEGQFRLPDNDAERLNDLDNEAVAAVEAGDEAKFHSLSRHKRLLAALQMRSASSIVRLVSGTD